VAERQAKANTAAIAGAPKPTQSQATPVKAATVQETAKNAEPAKTTTEKVAARN